MSELDEARKKINAIDKQMAKLFEERMEQSFNVANYKIKNGLPIFDAVREKEVIERNLEYIHDSIVKEYYVNFLKNIMKESRAYQGRIMEGMKVAYSGVPGAFSYIAAKRMFPKAELIACSDFEEAYKACRNGKADAVVLPIENSFAGDVGLVMDLIFNGDLYINNMIELEVEQNLLGIPGAALNDIKEVISHPQALAQSAEFLKNNNIKVTDYANTALAAQEVFKRHDKSLGAVASKETADIFGLEVIAKHINSSSYNTTRFAFLSRVQNKPDPKGKMGEHFIIVYTVLNEAGALAKTLNIIGSHGFNMRNLRSRPMKELLWNYYFFVEVEGNINTEEGEDMLIQLKTVCDKLKLVGTYTL